MLKIAWSHSKDFEPYGFTPSLHVEPTPGLSPLDLANRVLLDAKAGGIDLDKDWVLVARNPMGFQRQGSWYGDFDGVQDFNDMLDRWGDNAAAGQSYWTKLFKILREAKKPPIAVLDDRHYGDDKWNHHGFAFDKYEAWEHLIGRTRRITPNWDDEKEALLVPLRSWVHNYLRPMMIRTNFAGAGVPVIGYDGEADPPGDYLSIEVYPSRMGDDPTGFAWHAVTRVRQLVGRAKGDPRARGVVMWCEHPKNDMQRAVSRDVIRSVASDVRAIVYFNGREPWIDEALVRTIDKAGGAL